MGESRGGGGGMGKTGGGGDGGSTRENGGGLGDKRGEMGENGGKRKDDLGTGVHNSNCGTCCLLWTWSTPYVCIQIVTQLHPPPPSLHCTPSPFPTCLPVSIPLCPSCSVQNLYESFAADEIPLNHSQCSVWVAQQTHPQSIPCQAWACNLHPYPTPSEVTRAMNTVTMRHGAFQTRVNNVDGLPYQQLLPLEQLELYTCEIPVRPNSNILQKMQELMQEPFNLDVPPLAHLYMFINQDGNERDRLKVCCCWWRAKEKSPFRD